MVKKTFELRIIMIQVTLAAEPDKGFSPHIQYITKAGNTSIDSILAREY